MARNVASFSNLCLLIFTASSVVSICIGSDAKSASSSPLLVHVNTTFGPIVGSVVDGVHTFQGIPFAQPPVGDLRFRPPQPPQPWVEPLQTIDYKGACPQMGMPGIGGRMQAAGQAWNTLNLSNAQEDCLYMNIYAPANATDLPVMVYLHAGEFRFGGARDRESSGLFGNNSMILVTANARINIFGFAALDELRSRDPDGSTGNYGIQDQRSVMQWVQQSISRFGGDPKKVTIFGESSGGASVSMHLISNRSQGLYARAIVESPGITQSKTWKHSVDNTQFAISALTATRSKGCAWPSTATWLSLQGLVVQGSKLATLGIAQARQQCELTPACMLLDNHGNGTATIFSAGSLDLMTYDGIELHNVTQRTGVPLESSVEMLLGDPKASVDCLVNADMHDLVFLSYAPPHGDTFMTDAMAPTEDGVELTAPLAELVRSTPVRVDVLGGGNMDEGTEFMSLSPKIDCDATYDDFHTFTTNQFGAPLGDKVFAMYDQVALPVPVCPHSPITGSSLELANPASFGNSTSNATDKSFYYHAAMRAVGDAAIICRTRDLLLNAHKQGHQSWWYYFAATPIYSENMPDIPTMGAFHGAEIPYVFGDQFELKSDGERKLSQAMGCYWTNFATTGNPNMGDCVKTLGLGDWTPIGEDGDVIVFRNSTIDTLQGFKKQNCDEFAMFP
eukprot:m.180138 g.180138  ORF g.180138 m.180138 type:complete len:676 (+) comp32008_c0_seq1:172-2199(+)